MTDTEHPTAEDWRNRCERAEAEATELRKAMDAVGTPCTALRRREDDDAILLPVSNELANMIVRAWLKLHMAYAQDAYDIAIHPEDRDAALADLHAFNQVLSYVGEEND